MPHAVVGPVSYLVGRPEQRGPRLAGALSPSASRLSSPLVCAAGHMSVSWLLSPECHKKRGKPGLLNITAFVRWSSCTIQFTY